MQRSGRFFRNARDLSVDLNEHLMIFCNILLLDNTICIRETYDKWRQRLCSLVHCIPGRADFGSISRLVVPPVCFVKHLSEGLHNGGRGLCLKVVMILTCHFTVPTDIKSCASTVCFHEDETDRTDYERVSRPRHAPHGSSC